jgi:Ca2+-binding RTX toxin-like protein
MAIITSTDPLVFGSANADEIHTVSINGSASTIIGGLGNDVYFIDAFYDDVIDTPADIVIEALNEGIDTVKLNLSTGAASFGNINPFILFDNVENLEVNLSALTLNNFVLTGNSLANKITVLSSSTSTNASISGGAGNDTLIGGAGNDTLIGGTDADSMVGGLGNDTYVVDSLLDKVTETATALAGGGDDLVQSTVNFSLGANIERLTLQGFGNINGTGNALNNIITGNNANNIINGGAGNDNLNGGIGSDTLIGGLGNDTLTGGTGTNRIDGGAGDDLYIISSNTDIVADTGGGIDKIVTSVQLLGDLAVGIENLDLTATVIAGRGNALNNMITGNISNNILLGLAGNDTLDGGGGIDNLFGGLGNDTYIVDSDLDVVTEDTVTGGIDTVFSSAIFFELGNHLENLTLTGIDSINGIGNSLANKLIGNIANNGLTGGGGDDTLDGGVGDDSMTGGDGNDTYEVDSTLDEAVETSATGGIDTVFSRASTFTLGANVEKLTLAGTGNISGTGNIIANTITGNTGNNSLDGGGGNDTLFGGLGNDTLNGGSGVDSMTGGLGNDEYYVDEATDKVVELAGQGSDKIFANINYTLASLLNIEHLELTGTGDFSGIGNALNNDIVGNTGNNSLNGGAGNDYLNGAAGLDTLIGGLGNDLLNGGADNDSLDGGAGDDVLDGGAGDDTLVGGLGNDSYVVDSANDVVTETNVLGSGVDTVFSSISTIANLGSNIENLTLAGAAIVGLGNTLNNVITGSAIDNVLSGNDGNDSLSGGAGADTLNGGNGNDSLNGGIGNDTMFGGIGDDTYYVDSATDVVNETGGTGLDTVIASVTFDMSTQSVDNIENLTLAGTGNINGTGNTFANTITGNAGNNTLSGGLGNDTLIGGLGDDDLQGDGGADSLVGGFGADWYFVDDVGDKVVELAGQGIDKVFSSIEYSLLSLVNVEELELTGVTNINGTGNALNNNMVGNSGNNSLVGGAGNDTINGSIGADTLIGGAGHDSLTGGVGIDRLEGGLGDDLYVMDDAGDIIVENANAGIDAVRYNLAGALSLTGQFANIEQAILTEGFSGTHITGNNFNNLLLGNTGNNSVDGGAGNDVLYGGIGTGAGNDTLIGGTGADTMIGGIGDDVYYVDNISDRVVENAGQGTDTVESSINFSLAALVNVENLTLTGAAINGTGNALNNIMIGNGNANLLNGGAGNDTLNGGTGADSMIGGLGNDVYHVDNIGDKAVENLGQGTDTIESSINFSLAALVNVENLTLTGAAINGTGNALNNIIIGNDNANLLNGGAGNDTLTGGAGNDVFATSIGEGTDTITDFTVGQDTLRLLGFTSLTFAGVNGSLSDTQFVLGANSNDSLVNAVDADDFIIYNQDTGNLYYDADGNGAGLKVQIVDFTGIAPALSSADIFG